MKHLFTILLLFFTLGSITGQAIPNNIELTIREDLTPPAAGQFIVSQGFTAYSVYARPIASYTSQYNLGNTQISVALPKGLTYWGSGFFPSSTGSLWVDSDDGGTWVNQDVVEDAGGLSMDYHAVASGGRTMNGSNPLIGGTEYRLYTIYIQGTCNDDIRLFINGTDPDSGSMPGGGDFNNNFIHQVAAGNFPDEYSNNYTSGTPVCLPVLPVELISFRVQTQKGKALVEWSTATEINNDYFEVQRSKDGRSWEVIGMVDGAGTTTVTQEYEFIDGVPYLGVNYYRLEQFDFDGSSEYSEVRKVVFEDVQEALTIRMSPNPTAGQLRITANQQLNNHCIVLVDVTGRILMNNDFVNGAEIDLKDFNPGMYLVRIFNQRKEIVKTQRVIKTAN